MTTIGRFSSFSLAGGVGCALACLFSEKLSKDRTYVNVIMSDNLRAMQNFRDFLVTHHITNVVADTYTLDWSKKTISITAYPETKEQSRLITEYIEHSPLKFKRVVQKNIRRKQNDKRRTEHRFI